MIDIDARKCFEKMFKLSRELENTTIQMEKLINDSDVSDELKEEASKMRKLTYDNCELAQELYNNY